MTAVVIRPMQPRDVESVVNIRRAYLPLGENNGESSAPEVEAMTYVVLNHRKQNSILMVAESAGSIVGYSYARPFVYEKFQIAFSTVYWLNHLVVLASHRGKGIGKDLVQRTIVSAKHRGYQILAATISSSNEQFYKVSGWEVSAPGHGLAWIDPPTEDAKALLAADDPLHAFRRVSPLFIQTPINIDGYDRIAIKMLQPNVLHPAWFFPATPVAEDNRDSAVRTLIEEMRVDRGVALTVPPTAMLQFGYDLHEAFGPEEANRLLVASAMSGNYTPIPNAEVYTYWLNVGVPPSQVAASMNEEKTRIKDAA